MKRSEILYRILLALFTLLVIAVFMLPQSTIESYEILFLWVILPFMGFLWIRAYIDGIRGN